MDVFLPVIAVAALLIALVSVVWSFLLTRRLAGPSPGAIRAGSASPEPGNADLESRVAAHAGQIRVLGGQLDSLASRTLELEGRSRKAVQRFGLVRYNPFEDTGSNQSFALALLDEDDDGVILSSLHARQSTRVFLKPIVGGRAEASLSAEETEALRLARSDRRASRP